MKKTILTLSTAFMMSAGVFAQGFFEKVDYIGAFDSQNDWTKQWSNFNPATTIYPATDSTLETSISTNTVLSPSHTYLLKGFVHVLQGATLTILPGTIIRGDQESHGSLVITKGAKIHAAGTAEKPIVFTSNKDGDRARGDWGGLMIFGQAKINVPGNSRNFEALEKSPLNEYGGTNDEDSSGVLMYVRVEYPGYAYQVNKEVNGITFGAVGSKTLINYVQVTESDDDSFEWFGGTVNAKHLIAARGTDDDFDTDEGFRGLIQFAVGQKDPQWWDKASGGASNGFESDNNTDLGTANQVVPGIISPQPNTAPIFSNVTIIGPILSGATASVPAPNNFNRALLIRSGSSLSVFNSIIVGYPKGFALKHNATVGDPSVFSKAAKDSISIEHVIFTNNPTKFELTDKPATSSAFDPKAWLMETSKMNDTAVKYPNTAAIGIVDPYNLNMPNFLLSATSTAQTGAAFTNAKLANNLVTGINDASETNMAISAMPNPFSDNTVISYSLQTASVVNISVYDMKGNVVAELANGLMPAGTVAVNFNGAGMAKGIYVAKALTGSTVKTVKLIVK